MKEEKIYLGIRKNGPNYQLVEKKLARNCRKCQQKQGLAVECKRRRFHRRRSSIGATRILTMYSTQIDIAPNNDRLPTENLLKEIEFVQVGYSKRPISKTNSANMSVAKPFDWRSCDSTKPVRADSGTRISEFTGQRN